LQENNYLNNNIDEDEINLKELFATIFKYKYSIIFVTILAICLSLVYLYFKPNIYKAESTIEISSKNKPSFGDDILSAALSQGTQDIDTEIQILKSRFVSSMALKKVDFLHHYYGVKNYKKYELYKNIPFKIELKNGYDIEYKIIPLNKEKYILEVKKSIDKDGKKWNFYREVEFGELIKNKHFEIKIEKNGKLNYKEYRFLAKNPKYLADEVRKKLNVSQAGKKAAIVAISYEDNIPLRAKEYVNAVADSYLKQSIERKTREASKKLEFIDKQLEGITKSLHASAKDLENFKEKTNTVSLSSKADIVIQRSAQLETQL